MNERGLCACTLSTLRTENPTRSGANAARLASSGSADIRASHTQVSWPAARSAPSMYAKPSG
ncbi:hypothetical protein DB354_01115 [Opitutus sp. ER46]|nr:hypothetical protein DB354_01115 [Opitutus sp. ER46]